MNTEMISALTALVAVIISPIVSIYITKRQINASVISSNRQKWINDLRDQLSELITLLTFINFGYREQDTLLDKFEDAYLIETKIKLLINPEEDDHVELTSLIRTTIEEILRKEVEGKSERLRKLQNSIVILSQKILKREWSRVKKGE